MRKSSIFHSVAFHVIVILGSYCSYPFHNHEIMMTFIGFMNSVER